MDEVEARLDKGERRYAQDKRSQTDGRTGRLITKGHPQSGALIKILFFPPIKAKKEHLDTVHIRGSTLPLFLRFLKKWC